MRQHLVRHPDQTEEVGVEELLRLSDRTLLRGAENADPGVIDQTSIRPARSMTVDTAAVTDSASLTSSRRQFHAGNRLGSLWVAAGAEYLEALGRERARDGLSDSRRRTGDQYHGRSLCHAYS